MSSLEFTYPFLESASALDTFVRSWEEHTLPKAQWTHAAHVGVCAYYTAKYGAPEALRRMQTGIPPYNVATGGANTEDNGYHETLTCLWAAIIYEFILSREFASDFEAVHATVIEFGQDRKRHELYYSYDVVRDRNARREWVEPDRRRLGS